MENFEEQARLARARKKVQAIKGFYKHLAAYLIVNVILIIMHSRDMKPGEAFLSWDTFSVAFFWGIGLLVHGFGTFGTEFFLGSNWEERKIREYMGNNPERKTKWE